MPATGATRLGGVRGGLLDELTIDLISKLSLVQREAQHLVDELVLIWHRTGGEVAHVLHDVEKGAARELLENIQSRMTRRNYNDKQKSYEPWQVSGRPSW